MGGSFPGREAVEQGIRDDILEVTDFQVIRVEEWWGLDEARVETGKR